MGPSLGVLRVTLKEQVSDEKTPLNGEEISSCGELLSMLEPDCMKCAFPQPDSGMNTTYVPVEERACREREREQRRKSDRKHRLGATELQFSNATQVTTKSSAE